MRLEKLKKNYKKVLEELDSDSFIKDKEDKYSGVFLSYPFDDYYSSEMKIMIVGRETAHWNTNNGKNTIKRIVNNNLNNNTMKIVEESFERYSKHIDVGKKTSKFRQFYNRVAKELGLKKSQLIYSNLYAWDYNGKTPTKRDEREFKQIRDLSIKLLAESIKFSKPDIIVFAVGCNKINDDTIKELFDVHFNGHEIFKENFVSKKYWQFTSNNMIGIRIAHPRANEEHSIFRDVTLNTLKEFYKNEGSI